MPFLRRHQMSDSTQEILKVSRLSPGFRENFPYASNTFSTVSFPLISTYLQPGELQHMAGGQALVCGIQLILMVFLPPFPSLPFASLTLSSRAAVRQRRRQPENFSLLLWLTAGRHWDWTSHHSRPSCGGAARLTGAQHLTDNSR